MGKHRTRVTGRMLTIVVLFLCSSLLLPSLALGNEVDDGHVYKDEILKVGFIETAFEGVSVKDKEAAFKVLANTIGQTYGYNIDVEFTYFADAAEFDELSKKVQPDVVIFESWTWLDLTDTEWLAPVFVSSDRGNVANRYLLVTNEKSNVESLHDVQGGSINIYFGTNSELGLNWLKHLACSQTGKQIEQIFANIGQSGDPMETILPVFFGKTDVAVIPEPKFELMSELNPQLNRLKKVAVSEPLVSGVTCLKKEGWPSETFHQHVFEALRDLHLSPAGKQILTLFKMDQEELFKPEYLDSVRRLKNSFSCGS